jgi:hypothetical protein
MLNVNLLTVNSHCLCGFAALKVSQPVAEFTEPRAVPLFLAEGSGDRREPVPGATNLRLKFQDSSFRIQLN